jgi:hypothetical protein
MERTMALGTEQQGTLDAWVTWSTSASETLRGVAGTVAGLALTLTLCWTGLGALLDSATARPASTQVVSGTFTAPAPMSYAQAQTASAASQSAIGQ